MRRIACLMGLVLMMGACAKHDPILPGERTAIFDSGAPVVLGLRIDELPRQAFSAPAVECPYSQDASNVIWRGGKKIFSGFPTSNSVKSAARPVCDGKYVYAGLTTGELVKINPASRGVVWIADIYRDSNMTGGSSILDIVAPVVVRGDAVYAGGLGDAFCRLDAARGTKKWCVGVGTAHPFVIVGDAIFMAATDGALYALRTSDGAIYWRSELKWTDAPVYDDGVITVDGQRFDAATGRAMK